MKRAALYMRVSTVDQHPKTQLLDLRQMAAQRGYEVVAEFTDKISGTKAKRPGLDAMMSDARRGRFDVVLVWGILPDRQVGETLPRCSRRVESSSDRVRLVPGKYRHWRTAGPGHRDYHRRHR
jgi:hypothetical protein